MLTPRKQKLARLSPLLLTAVMAVNCYSVSSGPTGYQKQGVWLLHHRESTHQPRKKIVVGDHEMLFDDELRVYRIVDMPGHFYSAGTYYRRGEDQWEATRSLTGLWGEVPDNQVPPSLTQAEPRS